ncbi:MAG: hypothetical protein LBK55_10760 [Azoarcus sp.]|nr:hypothetical protein [Azoarcus sp.]
MPPATRYRKSASPVWLAIAGVFVLLVGGLWWGLGMSDAPIVNPDAVRNKGSLLPKEPPVETPPMETPFVETPPVETPFVETPPVETPPVETPPVETPPVETPPVETPFVETPPRETPPRETPPRETPPKETPPRETPPREATKRLPIPPEWLDTMREESAQCDSFFCHARVQRKYCKGYWNRLPECKRNGNGL